jgi:transposase
MQDKLLFQLALGLSSPWQVANCRLDIEKKQLKIELAFTSGSHFECPVCHQPGCPVHDTLDHTWRHLNFFQYETYLTARVPRVRCEKCGVKLVNVPWARPGSGFTLLFEALVMLLVPQMPVKAAARIVGEHDTRLWRILESYIDKARMKLDLSALKAIGIDETASRRGHNYVTLFADLDTRRVIFATEGKDADTIMAFRQDLFRHDHDGSAITDVSCDMSPAFIKGVGIDFPQAAITFDRFHIMKLMNEAVDLVRREEQRTQPVLKKSRFAWMTRPDHLTIKQSELVHELSLTKYNLKTALAYRISLMLQNFWYQEPEQSEAFLKYWYRWAVHCHLKPVVAFAKTVKRHWRGIMNWFRSRISNGLMEGLCSLIQAAKARARGYRTTKNLISMIYLIAGKLNFDLPT